jgi:very-short-patch-repair endonuclease
VLVRTAEGVIKVDLVVDLPDGRTLVIEVDGVHHDDPRQRARDAARDAALIAQGYLVLRIPVSELRVDPAGVVRRLRLIAQSARAS